MAVNQALATLGLLDCRYQRLIGHGYEANHGMHLIYSLPENRRATVAFRVGQTRSITNAIPQRPWRDALLDEIGDCPIRSCELTIEQEKQPETGLTTARN